MNAKARTPSPPSEAGGEGRGEEEFLDAPLSGSLPTRASRGEREQDGSSATTAVRTAARSAMRLRAAPPSSSLRLCRRSLTQGPTTIWLSPGGRPHRIG